MKKYTAQNYWDFFSSKQKCRDIINCYLQKPGFKDFPNDFQEEIVHADTDDF